MKKVICVNTEDIDELVEGNVYTVIATATYWNDVFYNLEGVDGAWSELRFKDVEDTI